MPKLSLGLTLPLVSVVCIAYVAQALYGRLLTLGIIPPTAHVLVKGSEYHLIPDTINCEDLHYHPGSGLLYAACQDKPRVDGQTWFPPLARFDVEAGWASRGGLVVVDPKVGGG
jgi:hypothetical protein